MEKRKTIHRIADFLRDLPVVLKIYLFIALLAPYFANDKPWIIQIGGETSFPAFSAAPYFSYTDENGERKNELTENTNWQHLKSTFVIFSPFGYMPGRTDLTNANFTSPFQQQYLKQSDGSTVELSFFRRHLLGTGRNGEDVFAGLVAGTRSSLAIGLLSMVLAGILGIVLGLLAGFAGDDLLKIRRGHLFVMLLLILPAWFYSFTLQSSSISKAFHMSAFIGIVRIIFSAVCFFLILALPSLLKIRFGKSDFLNKSIALPIDFIIMRFTELFLSMPRLILILTIAAISRPSVESIIIIIGLTSWTEIARLTRAEVLKLKTMDFVMAGRASGLNTRQILMRHLLPNSLPAVSVLWIYGVASAIMVETGLSFLGVGVPAGTVTWGSLMFSARENFTAWWMVVFPGAAIALLLVSLNRLGRKLAQSHRKMSQSVNNF